MENLQDFKSLKVFTFKTGCETVKIAIAKAERQEKTSKSDECNF